uniref:Uncharacterized protein n=1 Tax=Panagrolaimus sp. ES5 TaxID=591445 RepID=A0AC34GFV3_9BILA
MAAYVMFQEEESKSEHHRYDSYDGHFDQREPSSFKSKLAKFTSSSIIRRILEYIPGFEMIAQKLDSLSTVVYVALDAVFLPFEAIQSIHRWFNGEISGRRCAKTIVDASAAVAGGIGGAAVGASIGAVGGPVGSVIGGIIGGLFGSSVAATIMD